MRMIDSCIIIKCRAAYNEWIDIHKQIELKGFYIIIIKYDVHIFCNTHFLFLIIHRILVLLFLFVLVV